MRLVLLKKNQINLKIKKLMSYDFYLLKQPLVTRHDELRERARQLLEQARSQSKTSALSSPVSSPVEVSFC